MDIAIMLVLGVLAMATGKVCSAPPKDHCGSPILQCSEHETKRLTTEVSAMLNGIQVPFVGVSGSSACDSITRADSGDSAPCPLKPDVEYVYSKTFPIETFYPSLSVKVHWALNDGKKDIICFEAPVVIK